jgi:nitrous oxide reductase accessory protein NosL
MLKKIFITALALFFLSVPGFNQALAEDVTPACVQLDEKASGDMIKYSLHGEANGPVFFSGINCAIEHRNRELCAMEMISFDTTAKVYDYNTAEEIDISKAYFCLDEKNNAAPIVAFGSQEDAEKYGAETEGAVILDYTGLTDRELK